MKNLILLMILGIIGTLINIIDWIPSKPFELFRYIALVAIFFIMLYVVYKIIMQLYEKFSQKHSKKKTNLLTAGLALVLLAAVLIVALGNFVFFVFSGIHVKTYIFENKTFYIYEVGFMDSIREVSVKRDYLPIRKALYTTVSQYYHNEVMLIQEGEFIYFSEGIPKVKVYDFKNQ